jgi:hypothetical protein
VIKTTNNSSKVHKTTMRFSYPTTFGTRNKKRRETERVREVETTNKNNEPDETKGTGNECNRLSEP